MPDKIKILQTIRQGKIGGGERHVIDLVEALDKSVYEPIVLSFTDGEMISHLKNIGVEVHVIYTEKGFDYKVWPKVEKLIKERGVALVHAHGTRACSNSFWPAKKRNIPCLYTVHGWSFHQDQPFIQNKIRSFLEGVLVKQVDGTILVSDNNAKEASEMFHPKKQFVVKNGVNLNRFSLSTSNHFRKELGVADSCFLVGYIARMTKQKDPQSMIRAMKIVAEQNEEIKLLMIGSGELDEEVNQLIEKLDLTNIIRLPFRTDIPEILSAIDVYCLPSLWEGLPIGVLEAMAMSKPVIATAIPGNSELIEVDKNGYLCKVNSPESVAEKIIDLSSLQVDTRKSMGQYSRIKIEEAFSVDKMTRKIEQLYMNFLQ